MHWDLTELIRTVGYAGLFAIVFSESGLFFGAFFPGDSLLFTAGFLASQGFLGLTELVLVCVAAAILGDTVGYATGHRFGRQLFERPDSRWFRRQHLLAAEAYYEKHGGKTIILARFLPIVRTFAPIVAGIGNMRYRRFLMFNVAGGVLWGAGVTTAGYLLGEVIPDVDRYLVPIILGIIVISLLPTLSHVASSYRKELLAALDARMPRRRIASKAHEAKDTTEQPARSTSPRTFM